MEIKTKRITHTDDLSFCKEYIEEMRNLKRIIAKHGSMKQKLEQANHFQKNLSYADDWKTLFKAQNIFL